MPAKRRARLGGVGEAANIERRVVTVLFADLVGFTALSESLDAEDVASVQDAYFSAVRETIRRYGGSLEKFIGDAAMAVFGVPRTREDDAERAVRAGLALAAAVEALGGRVGLDEGRLRLRVGINTGEVAYAATGPDEGRVTGDTVNTAARLQAAAPEGGVLLGEGTALAVAGVVDVAPARAIELKGKAEPVRASVVLALRPEPSREAAMGRLHAPLVGRERELAAVREALSTLQAGSSRLLLVVAPPGVGKSRFVTEVGSAALAEGLADDVWGTRLRPEGGPFDALVELLGAALGSRAGDVPERADLERRLVSSGVLAPARAAVVADALLSIAGTGPSAGDEEDPRRRAAAWLDGLDALAAGRALLWIAEDLHWAGPDLLAVLDEAGRRAVLGGGRRLVLAATRPSLLEGSKSLSAAERFELPPLATGDASRLVRTLIGDVLPDDLLASLAERSDGNALFIEELIRTWIAVGTLAVDSDGTWRLTVPAAMVTVPTTVQAVYAAQIDDLPGPARGVVRNASVSGRQFPGAALPSLGVTEPEPALARLIETAIVSGPRPDPIQGGLFAYRHALLRDAGYASLARAERARLHVRLARWLERAAGQHSGDLADVIGGHYEAALSSVPALAAEVDADLDRGAAAALAAEWLERGADRAVRLTAVGSGAELYRRALALTSTGPSLDRARRLTRMGEVLSVGGDKDEAGRWLQEAAETYRSILRTSPRVEDRTGARSGLAEATWHLGRAWREQLRFLDAQHLAEHGLAEIGDAPDGRPDGARARLLLLAAAAEHAETEGDTTVRLEEALAIARGAGDRRLELAAMQELSLVDQELGRPDPYQAPAEAMARELGDWRPVISSIHNRAVALSDRRPTEALALLADAGAIAEARGLSEEMAWNDYARAEALVVAGDLDGAVAACERALAIAERYSYRRAAVRTYFVLIPIAQARGDRGPAVRLVAFNSAQSGAFPDSPYARIMRPALDLHVADLGAGEPYVPEVEPRLHSFDTLPAGASWLLAVERVLKAWSDAGELDGVAEAVRRMEAFWSHPDMSDLARGTVDIFAARLALARGDASEARLRARAAVERLAAIPAPWWTAKAQQVLESTATTGPDRP